MNGLTTPIILGTVTLVILIQSGADLYFSRMILPGSPRKRFLALIIANTAGLTLTGLVYRLTLPITDAYLLSSREHGSMAVAMLLMIVAYFAWMAPVVGIRGWIVQEWLLADAIVEKRQAWWSYAWVGQIVSVVLLGALYVSLTLIPPLMLGVDQHLG